MNSAFSFVRNHSTRMKRTPATMTVLVVDDEEPVRRFVERVLREAGYKTATAGGGAEAIDIATKMESLDILVTDVMMPQMTGDELARRCVKRNSAALKVLYLTGLQRPPLQGEGDAVGRRSVPRQAVRRAGSAAGGVALLFDRVDVPIESIGRAASRPSCLSAARVHLEMGVRFSRSCTGTNARSIAERQTILGAAIVAALPASCDQLLEVPRATRPAAAAAQVDAMRSRTGTGTTCRRRSAGSDRSSRQNGSVVDEMMPNVVPSGRANRSAGADEPGSRTA